MPACCCRIALFFAALSLAQAAFTQEGPKLVGAGYTANPLEGAAVALSADGNTAIVGSEGNGSWIFTRAGGVWSQQGNKLVANDSVFASEGWSVSMSADGNTAMVGGFMDNGWAGAAWVWTRTGGVWTQQGPKLVGTGAIGPAAQGFSVSLSADGSTAIVGGPSDNNQGFQNGQQVGAAWVWTRSAGM